MQPSRQGSVLRTSGIRRRASTSSDLHRQARILAAVLVAAVGAIHLYLWFDYFHRVHTVGELFLANAAAGLLIAVWLLVSDSVLVMLAGAGFAATTLAAFLISTRWGLFGYHERFWGSWQLAAGLLEVGAALLLAALSAATRVRPSR